MIRNGFYVIPTVLGSRLRCLVDSDVVGFSVNQYGRVKSWSYNSEAGQKIGQEAHRLVNRALQQEYRKLLGRPLRISRASSRMSDLLDFYARRLNELIKF